MASFIFKEVCDMFIGTFPAIKYLLTFVVWDWVGLGAVSSLSLLRLALGRAWCYPCSLFLTQMCPLLNERVKNSSSILYHRRESNFFALTCVRWCQGSPTARRARVVSLSHLSVSQAQLDDLIRSVSMSPHPSLWGEGWLIITFLILQTAKLRHGKDGWLSLIAEQISDGVKPSSEGALIS